MRSTATVDAIRVPAAPTASTPRFDWITTGLSLLFLSGIYLDGWAHTHGRVDATFFTPWHAVLYSAYLANAAFLCGAAAYGLRRGRPWRHALPAGYGLALAGAALWVVGGPFDAAWHEIFGFEADVEALMSPAHAILALGVALIASGPVRAALSRARRRWRDELPLVLAIAFVVSILTFFTQIAHPLANLWGTRHLGTSDVETELGIAGTLLTSAILLAPLLALLRRGRLPAGAFTIVLGLNALATGVLYDRGPYPRAAVVAVIIGALAVDAVRVVLRPRADRHAAFYAFAFAAGALPCLAYFLAVRVMTGIAWSLHLWLGTVVFVGITGCVLAWLVLPARADPGPAPV